MTQKAIKNIIFDFGNVVGLFDLSRALQRILPHTDYSEEQIRGVIRDSDLEDAYESGRMSTEEFLQEVRRICRLNCGHDLLKSAWCEIFFPNVELCQWIPRLKDKFRLLLGSNTNELHADHFRRQFADTLQHFDKQVLSYEIGVRKPLAGFFEHCVAMTGSQPGECVFIDDLAENIKAAQACGLHGIVYKNMDDMRSRMQHLGISVLS